MLGIGAQATSPAEVWRDQMRPKLEALTARTDAAGTVDRAALAKLLNEAGGPRQIAGETDAPLFADSKSEVQEYWLEMADAAIAAPMHEDFLAQLRCVNADRLAAWCSETELPDGLFHATELGGEVGEVLKVVKKLHRGASGWRGSRATVADLAEEIGDVVVCLDKLAAYYGIDLAQATAAKFNATSEKVGLPHRLPAAQSAKGFSRFDPPGLWESEPRSSADDAGEVGR
ncbi:MazG-like family protein [Sphingomonas echinoides]|uniref:MazG-like family protein n=1 Tax=Sphingomonas echinoides TaxID=59803 RepID=UPI0024138F0C|nr:MazG-like family protein [Sphingomonas echinoides]